jgi:outer membrane protein OmpA-like peptidoglycan-associated protein
MKAYIDGGFNGDPLFRFKNLNFASGSAKLDVAAQGEVDNVSAILKAYPGVNIEINGHTDNDGDAAKNKELSQARAQAVVARLIGKGIDAARLKAQGFGQEQPVADNGTPEGKAQNRRIEIKVVQ